jgi:hypothetical protein
MPINPANFTYRDQQKSTDLPELRGKLYGCWLGCWQSFRRSWQAGLASFSPSSAAWDLVGGLLFYSLWQTSSADIAVLDSQVLYLETIFVSPTFI